MKKLDIAFEKPALISVLAFSLSLQGCVKIQDNDEATFAQADIEMPETAKSLQWARNSCSKDDDIPSEIIDASQLRGASALVAKIETIGEADPIIVHGSFVGEDFSALSDGPAAICFVGTDLQNTKWDKVNLTKLRFIDVNLSSASFYEAVLPDIYFHNVNLTEASFGSSKLKNGIFVGGWRNRLGDTSFRNADLSGFTFYCGLTMNSRCSSTGGVVNMSGTNLTDSNLSSFPSFGAVKYDGALVNRTKLSPRDIPYFEKARTNGPVILENVHPRAEVQARLTASEFRQLIVESVEARMDSEASAVPGSDCSEAANCVIDGYRTRASEVTGSSGDPLKLQAGESMEFYEEVLPLSGKFRHSDVYRRILPVLKSAAFQNAKITKNEDGTYRVRGNAVGGNGHLCGLIAHSLKFDPGSGWFSGPPYNPEINTDQDYSVPVLGIVGNSMIFPYSGNVAQTPEPALDYYWCGARAGFNTMKRLDP
ncbi:pentapeptide repeat-containing protein [Sphingorhabdus sp. YGSMI21]|uniref:pentapeptide repeat-containing protein n=1 Tax=Sphingorhabdus sp. YGSMI21 TaxID=2077182 RepID=UPI000C1E656D|nr:pentapeptide repeat-containing protein [Sphingorhabdus sp. YGSMI21]ATW04223.1 hypothetical protein CHN51_12295 [Sphingorhabdus sp. YGSMI21]